MTDQGNLREELERAAKCLRSAEALIICAGSEFSSMPNFHDPEVFMEIHPGFKTLGMNFQSMCNPSWFRKKPKFAWGFFGYWYNLIKTTQPHAGYQLLKKWADSKKHGYFIFTNNVDGLFQKAGVPSDNILECHGSMHYMQCCKSMDITQGKLYYDYVIT